MPVTFEVKVELPDTAVLTVQAAGVAVLSCSVANTLSFAEQCLLHYVVALFLRSVSLAWTQ